MAQLILCTLAAFSFALGGVFMKNADGLRNWLPSAAFLTLFLAGAVLQSEAMRGAGMAVTYVLVLGLEAALAASFGIFLFGEHLNASKAAAMLLIVAGVALLRTH